VEALEGNKVKLVVEVEAAEFEKDLDAAFVRLAKEVRLPGFRPGKAPRKVLEARIGTDYARQEAFRAGLPDYYVEAVKAHEVDVIAPPSIEVTEGEDGGDITFEAEVEVRPTVTITGYESLEVTVPRPGVDEAEIDEQIERMLGQYGTLEVVERPAEDGDRVTIDIEVTHEGEPVAGLTTEDYLYQVGMGAVVPELDEHLRGASAGDHLSFSAEHPDEDEEAPLEFEIDVKEVQATVLPEADDEWARENSEFETLDELRADLRFRLGRSRVIQANTARRNNIAEAVAALVDTELVPASLVDLEFENRVQDMAMRLQAQGLDFEQFLQFSGQSREAMLADMRESAEMSARLDLALRAVAEAEGLAPTDEDLTEEFARVADQVDRTIDDVRAEFTTAGQLPAIRSDLAKSNALDWLVERATLVDEDGASVQAADLELPADDEESAEPTQEEEE
jgi:trigger factor